DLNELDADAWRKTFADISAASTATPEAAAAANAPRPPMSENVKQFIPTRAAIHFTTLKLLDRRWENIAIGASGADRK
ncbi:hypothetical protein, partial [Caballeronia sp. AAUFL_F1_KS45]